MVRSLAVAYENSVGAARRRRRGGDGVNCSYLRFQSTHQISAAIAGFGQTTIGWEYVRNNPVRHGYVETAAAWPFAGEIEVLAWEDD